MHKKMIVAICMLIAAASVVRSQQEQIAFQNLHSTLTVSENGENLFALIPAKTVDEYIEELKATWQRAGYSKKEIARRVNDLSPLIEEERERRRKYKQSGIYKIGSDVPVRKVEKFPEEIDSIYVANDGSYVVGFNADIITLGSTPNASIKELLASSQQYAVFALHFDDPNGTICSETVTNFEIENAVNRRTHSLVWADRESSRLDSKTNQLEIRKLNNETIAFDVKNCRVVQSETQDVSRTDSDNSNGRVSPCLGIALLIMLGFRSGASL